MKLLLLLCLVGSATAQGLGGGEGFGRLLCMLRGNCGQAQAAEPVDLAATCPEQVAASEKCVFDKLMTVKPSAGEQSAMVQRKEQVKAQVTQCFKSRGCRDPVAVLGGFKNCMKDALVKKIIDPFAVCVEDKGYELPGIVDKFRNGGDMEGLKARFAGAAVGRIGGDRIEKLRSKLSVVCDPSTVSDEAANAAFDCAVEAVQAARGDKGRGGRRGRGGASAFMKILPAIMGCKNNIGKAEDGSDCGAYAQERKDTVCGCAAQLDMDQLQADMLAAKDACKAQQGIEEDLLDESDKRNMLAKLGKAKGMIERFCTNRLF